MLDKIFQIIPLYYFITSIVLFPIIAAAVCLFLRSSRTGRFVGLLGPILSAFSTFIVAFALLGIENARPAIITGKIFDWFSVGNIDLYIGFRIDELSLAFMLITGIVSVTLASVAFVENFKKWIEFNIFLACIMLMISSDNVGMTLVGWFISGAVLYSLTKIRAGTLGGGILLIAATALMITSISASGDPISNILAWETWENEAVKTAPIVMPIAIIILIAAATRISLFPFIWDFGKGKDDIMSVTLSNSLVSLTGFYLILRTHFLLVLSPPLLIFIRWWGLIAGTIGIILALRASNFKKAMATTTGITSSLFMISVGVGGFAPAAIYASLHALLKGGMGITSGPVFIDSNGGLVKRYPVSGWCFVICAFILAGVAPGGGFFALESLVWTTRTANWGWWIASVTLAGFSAFALLRIAGLLFLGRRKDFPENEIELPPVSLVLIVAIPTIGVLLSLIHKSPFFGESFATVFFEGVLPSTLARDGGRKLSAALLLFATAQPAIIAAAVYAQRKWQVTSEKEPSLFKSIFGSFSFPTNISSKLLIDEILIGGIGRFVGALSIILRWISEKLFKTPLIAIITALILIILFGRLG